MFGQLLCCMCENDTFPCIFIHKRNISTSSSAAGLAVKMRCSCLSAVCEWVRRKDGGKGGRGASQMDGQLCRMLYRRTTSLKVYDSKTESKFSIAKKNDGGTRKIASQRNSTL